MILIDAGARDEAILVETTRTTGQLRAALTGQGTVEVPAAWSSGGIVVSVPAALSKDWPAQTGRLTIAINGDQAHVEDVTVVRTTANKKQLEQAAQAALTALAQMKKDNDAGIAVIDAWLAGAMPTTVAQVVPVLRTLAGQNKGAAQQRNAVIGIVETLIPLALQEYDG